MIAARMTEPPVGASTWASGSQVCTGHMGTFTANATRKRDEDQDLGGEPERHAVQVEDRERAGLGVQVQQRDQHQHRAEEGVEEELDGGVDALRSPPDPDDEEHRDEQRLPEHVEKDRIKGRERAHHRSFLDEEGGHVLRRLVLDNLPAREHHQHRHQSGEEDERHRDAVHPEVVVDVERRDPHRALYELHLVSGGVEPRPQEERQHEGQERDRQRHRAHRRRPAARAGEQHPQAAENRRPDDEAEEGEGAHRAGGRSREGGVGAMSVSATATITAGPPRTGTRAAGAR